MANKKRKKRLKRPNGKGTVYPLSGNRRNPWVAAITIGWKEGKEPGKPKQVKKPIGYFPTEDEAMKALLTYEYTPAPIDKETKVKDLYKIIEENAEKDGKTKSTIDTLKASYKAISGLGNRALYDLISADFQFIIDDLIEDPEAKSSFSKLNKIKSLVNKMYNILISHKVMTVNHAQFISLRGVKEGNIPPFPEKDIKTLFEHDSERIAKSSLILAYTGLRINEFLNLNKFDIDLKQMLIVGGSKTEAGKDRTIAIHPYIQSYVRYFYNEFPKSEIFFSRNGERVTPDYYRRYYHDPLILKLGLSELNPHSFRRTAASKMKLAGVDNKAITEMIGHVDINFTDKKYVTVDAEYLHREIEKIK